MQGGWCWLGSPYAEHWEFSGPFFCHHQDCRDTESRLLAEAAAKHEPDGTGMPF